MICEFALTPQIFDDQANAGDPAWMEHLRELGRSLLPRTGIHPVVVSNLYDGSWEHETKNTVTAIRDQAARLLAQGLLKQLKDAHLQVTRPPVGDWPQGEADWANEAVASSAVSRDAPISRVVVTNGTHSATPQNSPGWTAIGHVHANACWSDAQPWQSVPMRLDAQIRVLRTLICHADFIAIVTPHIKGGIDDETEFVCRLIRAVQSRPFRAETALIDIHTKAPDKPAASDYPTRLTNRVAAISSSINAARHAMRVRLFLWPRLLDRYILAGDLDPSQATSGPHRFRWAVAPQHIARPNDPATLKPTPWALIPGREIQPIADQFYSIQPASGPHDL